MKNDVGSYMTRKIGTGRIDVYARLCLHDEVVQGNAVVPDVCCYTGLCAYARLCLHDEVVQGNAVVPDVCC